MRTKDLIDLAANPNFISGIYNYCDRWCERCPFTSRCLVYAMETEEGDDPASRDIRNAEFWRKLQSIFEQAGELIAAWAEEHDVDLSTTMVESEVEENRRDLRDAKEHELSVAANNYATSVNEWFAGEFIELQGADDRVDEDTEQETETKELINDATEVIGWYQYQIAAKAMRALMSLGEAQEENVEDLHNDANGSIKVALIAIERSISGWRMMQIARPDRAESITPILLTLERLRQSTEQAFPRARDFIRPGFDEPACDLVN